MSSGNRWPWPRLLAHRGAGVLAPENTLAAFDAASRLGVSGVEFDVMLTADHHPILLHDTRLGRTLHGRGAVADLTLAQVQVLDAGAWLGPAWRGETVPLLSVALARLRERRLWANLEIKPTRGRDVATAHRVADVLEHGWPDLAHVPRQQLPLISSFSIDALQVMQQRLPALPRGLLVGRLPGNWLHRLRELEAAALHAREDKLPRTVVAAAIENGFGVMAYTVNEPVRAAQLRAWGVDAICTDRPDLLLQADPELWR